MSQQVDRLLFEEVQRLHSGLAQAQANLHRFKELLDKLTAPLARRNLPARLAGSVASAVLVHYSGTRRVMNLAEGLDPASFVSGDVVFVNADLTAVMENSTDRLPGVGETARFARYTGDRRIVVRYRDEELILDGAESLKGTALQEGDCVRIDRSAWIVFEQLADVDSQRYLMQEVPQVHPEQVGGQGNSLQTLLAGLTTTLVAPEKASRYGLNGRRPAILMVGPPGCGKTLMAHVVCTELARTIGKQCRFAVVKPAELLNPYVGATEQNIRRTFRGLSEAAKQFGMAVVFLDEIESIGRIRGSATGHHSNRFLGALLAEIDGFETRGDVAIMAATNRKNLLDPGLLSRFNVEIQVQRPDMRGRKRSSRCICRRRCPTVPTATPLPGYGKT